MPHTRPTLDAPHKVVLDTPDGHAHGPQDISLIVHGQGIVAHALVEQAPFAWEIRDRNELAAIRLDVGAQGVRLEARDGTGWKVLTESNEPGIGVDADPDCRYWFSIDCHSNTLRYGKGETRLATARLSHHLSQATGDNTYAWLHQVEHVAVSQPMRGVEVWRDPITTEPPLSVLPTDMIAMADVACNNATVPANLTPACQQLYANVAGRNFTLAAPDFPDFVAAIEASIRDPNGWCHKKLKEKADEFGKHNEEETYLRITMGVNQGESPGIPYVMEIWPPGHYSPIHNHAQANAIIRVLSGAIQVRLFPMLSEHHQEPFLQRIFTQDDVTWISPGLNQTHQLINPHKDGPTCITIQCYMYDQQNTTHYEYFDYLSEGAIHQFTPNSDMGFMEFRATMKAEWEARQRSS